MCKLILPQPLTSERSRWPWTEECLQLPATIPDGSPWPRISIVTPSYNQGQFIEATIRSVLLQGYPNLEYIIIDGGSTDGTVEIIKKYEPWLTYWVSEKDRGQANAINKGIKQTSGNILAWINSDDLYRPDTFAIVANRFSGHELLDLLWGRCQVINNESKPLFISDRSRYTRHTLSWGIGALPQPATFWSRRVWQDTGGLRENFFYAMDYDLWIRIALLPYSHLLPVSEVLAVFREQQNQKTAPQNRVGWITETAQAFRSYHPTVMDAWYLVLMRRLHILRLGRGFKRAFLDYALERIIFEDGAYQSKNSKAWLSRAGFEAGRFLLNIILGTLSFSRKITSSLF
jgi:glycosyltransferase involved in cell wall biosynthesis